MTRRRSSRRCPSSIIVGRASSSFSFSSALVVVVVVFRYALVSFLDRDAFRHLLRRGDALAGAAARASLSRRCVVVRRLCCRSNAVVQLGGPPSFARAPRRPALRLRGRILARNTTAAHAPAPIHGDIGRDAIGSQGHGGELHPLQFRMTSRVFVIVMICISGEFVPFGRCRGNAGCFGDVIVRDMIMIMMMIPPTIPAPLLGSGMYFVELVRLLLFGKAFGRWGRRDGARTSVGGSSFRCAQCRVSRVGMVVVVVIGGSGIIGTSFQ